MQGMFVFPANSYAEALSPRVFGIWKWGLWEVITFRYGHEGVSLIIGFNRINVLIRKGRERERERETISTHAEIRGPASTCLGGGGCLQHKNRTLTKN